MNRFKDIISRRKITVVVTIGLFLMMFAFTAPAQNTGRRQFYDIVELTKLITRAREAGFSDDELKKMQLMDGDTVINVNDYVNSIIEKKLIEDEKLKLFLSKKFLTIRDVYTELVNLEPEVLIKLREDLVSD